jgi:hypothetical protein
MNRPVRTRTRGGVGRAGEKLALTRQNVWVIYFLSPLVVETIHSTEVLANHY